MCVCEQISVLLVVSLKILLPNVGTGTEKEVYKNWTLCRPPFARVRKGKRERVAKGLSKIGFEFSCFSHCANHTHMDEMPCVSMASALDGDAWRFIEKMIFLFNFSQWLKLKIRKPRSRPWQPKVRFGKSKLEKC